ncbi:MAG: hypothetical protein Q8Q65_02965 [bacterium]|nr:hypothetical protein [bacterium]
MVNKIRDLSVYFGGDEHEAANLQAVPQSPTQLSSKPEIKVITHKQMAQEGAPSQKDRRKVVEKLQPNTAPIQILKHKKKRSASGKFIIVAIVLVLIAVDVPIGMRIYQGYNNRNNIAQSDVSQDTGASAKEAFIPPTSTPVADLISPTLKPTSTPTPTIKPTTKPTIAPTVGAGVGGAGDLALANGTQTHSECFEGACIEVEGLGADQCFVDSDCEQDSEESTAATPTPKAGDGKIVSPDVPVAGGIRDTIIGIAAGFATILLALLILI